MEPHRYRGIAPRIVEVIAAVRREYQVDAGALRRMAERSQLIAGGGRQDENSGHGRWSHDTRVVLCQAVANRYARSIHRITSSATPTSAFGRAARMAAHTSSRD